MNEAKRQWLSRALDLRRRLAERPHDVDLLAEADELAREGRRLGLKTKDGKTIDLGWARRP